MAPQTQRDRGAGGSIGAAQVVLFQLAGKSFAVELGQVEQIIDYRPPTKTPRRPPHVEGVIEHRGRYLALLYLRKRFGVAEAGPAHPAVLLVTGAGPDPRVGLVVDQVLRVAGTDHVAFTFADLGDLLYTYARLKGAGIEPYWCINHGPTTSMYYKDPDGNRVELQVDNYPTAEEANRWMRSGEFAANPIGVVFDPAALLARYRAGEPLATLTARPPLPEGTSPFDMLRF